MARKQTTAAVAAAEIRKRLKNGRNNRNRQKLQNLLRRYRLGRIANRVAISDN
jgi:hypothetical protein